jgi:hypothetical protein
MRAAARRLQSARDLAAKLLFVALFVLLAVAGWQFLR